jgi:threonine dehydratase
MPDTHIDRDQIIAIEKIIRPHIRRTPIIEADGRDFGIDSVPLLFKLELLQHSGSFKARGAFANLLLRKIPRAGVVAASGGNHGAAVAYAAMKLGVPAKIFVPTVASPEKIERIHSYGAELVVTGERVGVLVCGGNTAAVDFTRAAGVASKEHSLPSASRVASPSSKGD